MPITQARVIALIDEAISIYTAAGSLRTEVEAILLKVREGELSPADALSILQTHLTLNPEVKPFLLAVEQRHFTLNKKANTQRARRQREKRGAAGKNTAPDSLVRLGEKKDSAVDEFSRWNRGEK